MPHKTSNRIDRILSSIPVPQVTASSILLHSRMKVPWHRRVLVHRGPCGHIRPVPRLCPGLDDGKAQAQASWCIRLSARR